MAKGVFAKVNDMEKSTVSLRKRIEKLSVEIFKKQSAVCVEEDRRRGKIFQKISELESLLEQTEMDNFLKRRI